MRQSAHPYSSVGGPHGSGLMDESATNGYNSDGLYHGRGAQSGAQHESTTPRGLDNGVPARFGSGHASASGTSASRGGGPGFAGFENEDGVFRALAWARNAADSKGNSPLLWFCNGRLHWDAC